MIRISCYPNETGAKNAAEKLHERDIPATTSTEGAGDNRELGVLEVSPEHSEDAIRALQDAAGEHSIKCPECRSAHVLFPNRPEASPTAALVEMAAEALQLTDKTFLCHSCQHEWAPHQAS